MKTCPSKSFTALLLGAFTIWCIVELWPQLDRQTARSDSAIPQSRRVVLIVVIAAVVVVLVSFLRLPRQTVLALGLGLLLAAFGAGVLVFYLAPWARFASGPELLDCGVNPRRGASLMNALLWLLLVLATGAFTFVAGLKQLGFVPKLAFHGNENLTNV